jgi:hypothetical protein
MKLEPHQTHQFEQKKKKKKKKKKLAFSIAAAATVFFDELELGLDFFATPDVLFLRNLTFRQEKGKKKKSETANEPFPPQSQSDYCSLLERQPKESKQQAPHEVTFQLQCLTATTKAASCLVEATLIV